MLKKIISPILFGNYFIASCVVALCAETNFLLGYSFNDALFYCLIFLGTQIFYTSAYIQQTSPTPSNRRATWYYTNRKIILYLQYFFCGLLLLIGAKLLYDYGNQLENISVWQYFVISLPIVGAILYYGLPMGGLHKMSLRYTGWFKPFAIGFVWACVVTFYPLFFKQLDSSAFQFEITNQLQFIFGRNFVFISLLCILFDIKDYKDDYNMELKTFVVRFGKQKTLAYIITPLLILNGVLDFFYTDIYQPHFWSSVIAIIPSCFIFWISISLLQHKSIFFYLLKIDGMLIIKAACDIIGFLIFKKMI